jgi:hypothetical protein
VTAAVRTAVRWLNPAMHSVAECGSGTRSLRRDSETAFAATRRRARVGRRHVPLELLLHAMMFTARAVPQAVHVRWRVREAECTGPCAAELGWAVDWAELG